MSISANRAGRLVLSIIGVCAIIAAGFLILRHKQAPAPAPSPTLAEQPPIIHDTTYRLIQPSVGILQITRPVTITWEAERGIIEPLDPAFSPGMQIIAYDETGAPLPDDLKITAIDEGRAYTNTPFMLPARTEIVVFENILAKRVPNEAVQDTANLWRAIPQPDHTFKVEKITLRDPVTRNDVYTDVGGALRADEFLILNPDAQLADGAIIAAVDMEPVNAPALDPQEQAMLQLYDRQVEHLLAVLDATITAPATVGIACPMPDAAQPSKDDASCGTCASPADSGTQTPAPAL